MNIQLGGMEKTHPGMRLLLGRVALFVDSVAEVFIHLGQLR